MNKLDEADERNENIDDEMIQELCKFSQEPVKDSWGEALACIIDEKDIFLEDLKNDLESGFISCDDDFVFNKKAVEMFVPNSPVYNRDDVSYDVYEWLTMIWRLSHHNIDSFEKVLNKL